MLLDTILCDSVMSDSSQGFYLVYIIWITTTIKNKEHRNTQQPSYNFCYKL